MSLNYLFINSDNVLTVDELKNAVDDTYINDATVTVTLFDSDGVAVSGQTFPATMNYVSGSNGKYRATLQDDLSLTEDAEYEAVVSIDAGGDLLHEKRICLHAKYDYG